MRYKFIVSVFSAMICCFLMLFGGIVSANDIQHYAGAEKGPIANGPLTITSQFQPKGRLYNGVVRPHEGIDCDYDNVPLYAPVDGYALLSNSDPKGFGYYIEFLPKHKYDSERTDGDFNDQVGSVMIFGDVSGQESLDTGGFEGYNTWKEFKCGEPIGFVSGVQGNSNGTHLHFEYWIHGYKQENSLQDPVPMLSWLGITVLNYQPGADSVPDNVLSLEGLATSIGNFFPGIIDAFVKAANGAYEHIKPIAFTFLTVMCILDLTIPIILAGMVVSPFMVIRKCMKYAVFVGFVTYFPTFVNDGLWAFVNNVDGMAVGDLALIQSNVCAPQLLLQKGVYLISPMLSKIGHYGVWDTINNIGSIFIIYLCSFLVIGFMVFFAIIVTLTIIEFYVSAGLCISTVPFGVFGLTKFTSEGALGHLVNSAIRYMFLCIFIFLSVTMIQDAKPPNLFGGGSVQVVYPTTSGNYNPYDSSSKDGDKKDGDKVLVTTNKGMTLEQIVAKYPNATHVIDAAQKYGMDPYICLAIFGQESAFGTNTGGSGGFMQIDPNQSVSVVPSGVSTAGCSYWNPGGNDPPWNIRKLFPDLDTDIDQNCEAGVVMLFDKISGQNGDVIAGIKAYNGGGDPNYLEHVSAKYQELTGMPLINGMHMSVTSEQLWAFFVICTMLIVIVMLGYFGSKHLTELFAGPIPLP